MGSLFHRACPINQNTLAEAAFFIRVCGLVACHGFISTGVKGRFVHLVKWEMSERVYM